MLAKLGFKELKIGKGKQIKFFGFFAQFQLKTRKVYTTYKQHYFQTYFYFFLT